MSQGESSELDIHQLEHQILELQSHRKRDNARVEECEFRLSVDKKTERRSWDKLKAFELECQVLH